MPHPQIIRRNKKIFFFRFKVSKNFGYIMPAGKSLSIYLKSEMGEVMQPAKLGCGASCLLLFLAGASTTMYCAQQS